VSVNATLRLFSTPLPITLIVIAKAQRQVSCGKCNLKSAQPGFRHLLRECLPRGKR